MISDSLEVTVEKQRENESTKGACAKISCHRQKPLTSRLAYLSNFGHRGLTQTMVVLEFVDNAFRLLAVGVNLHRSVE